MPVKSEGQVHFPADPPAGSTEQLSNIDWMMSTLRQQKSFDPFLC